MLSFLTVFSMPAIRKLIGCESPTREGLRCSGHTHCFLTVMNSCVSEMRAICYFLVFLGLGPVLSTHAIVLSIKLVVANFG